MKFVRNASSRVFDSVLKRIELTRISDRLILRVLFFCIIFSGAYFLYQVNQTNSLDTPVRGGTLREGVIGTPRFVNPVLANTRADQDMTALIYSGLMKINPDGDLTPNLAESVTVSEDGLTYNVVLRKDIYFHDEVAVTAKDVLFTIRLIQNPDLKSPLRGNWTNVTLEEINDRELNIVLNEAYTPFIENFTLGIMPAHLWSGLPIEQVPFSQLNTEPVGSGSFKLITAKRDPSGVITGYTLTAHRNTPNPTNIEKMMVHFYNDEITLLDALKKQELDASAYMSNESVSSVLENPSYTALAQPLPRVFGIFFNQNKSAALRDEAVRKALSTSISRDEVIETALFGQGVPMTGPTAAETNEVESEEHPSHIAPEDAVEAARTILEDAGWRANNQGLLEKQIDGSTETLRVTLKTSNVPLFIAITNIIKRQWGALGVEVTVDQYEQSDLVQAVIRPRDFEALLFGLDLNRSEDLYPFWHSSQKDDPGLNIAAYTNVSVDALLASARTEQDKVKRNELLDEAATIIGSEYPAVFLFQPVSVYVVNKNFVIPSITQISRPSDRFNNMNDWYTNSDELWSIFRQSN